MKKKICMFFGFLCAAAFLSAQVSVDPADSFYKYAQDWEMKGLVKSLPLIRPYPSSTVKEILETVINSSNKGEAELALKEYERIFTKPYTVYAEGSYEQKISHSQQFDNAEFEGNFKGSAGVAGEISFHPLVSFGYDLGLYAETGNWKSSSPMYTNKDHDSYHDATTIGPLRAYLDWNTNIAVGTTNVYGMAGISRTGFGPFLNDGVALNDTAFHSANFIFNATLEKLSYASTFEVIGATTNNPDFYGNLSDSKYLALHALRYRFNDKFSLSYYENIVFGPRPIPAYFLPAPYMAIQNIGGASDNLQMGVLAEVVPFPGLKWAADVFVDDISLNDIVKFDFDTRIRLATQTGLIYSPDNSPFKRFSLDYQMVLPYVYAHWEYTNDEIAEINGYTVNYQNFTNAGVHIGSVLDPNSDKISFSADFQPREFLRFSLKTNFIRHCNSAEAFSDYEVAKYVLAESGQYATDGSVYMHQMFENLDGAGGENVMQAWKTLGFMTSGHKMGVVQAALKGEFDFPKTKIGKFTLKAGYVFEFVKNAGVNKNIYTGGKFSSITENDDGTYSYTYNGTKEENKTKEELYAAALAEGASQKNAWVSNLKDVINHYFTIGIKYTY